MLQQQIRDLDADYEDQEGTGRPLKTVAANAGLFTRTMNC